MFLQRVTEVQNTVKLRERMWARLLASTNQPSFLDCNEEQETVVDGMTVGVNNNGCSAM